MIEEHELTPEQIEPNDDRAFELDLSFNPHPEISPAAKKAAQRIIERYKAIWLYPYRILVNTKFKKGPRKGKWRYTWIYGQIELKPRIFSTWSKHDG